MGSRKHYETILRDKELLDYAREQARYTYLFDLDKFWRYVPGHRFKSQAYVTWRKNVKKITTGSKLSEETTGSKESQESKKRKAEDSGLESIDQLIQE